LNFCPVCNCKKSLTLKIKFPTFDHRDLNKIADYLILKECFGCAIIYNPNIKKITYIQKKIFLASNDYNLSLQNNRIAAIKNYGYSKKIFQLSKILNQKNLDRKILDIGALDGDLLKELRKKFNNYYKNKFSFYGYNFSKKKNLSYKKIFITNSLKFKDCFKNSKKYNIIISINSLQYVKKISEFLLLIKDSLKEINSFAFFVVPNSLDKISHNFHGDEFYKFTKKNILLLFARSGLTVKFFKNNINPDHFVFYAKKNKNYKNIIKFKNSFSELSIIKNKINNFLTSVSKISFKFKNNTIKIFGYRINAVILYYALIKFNFNSNKLFFITDDNVQRRKTLNNNNIFRKLIIYNKRNYVKNYNPQEKIILSYGSKRNNVFKYILKKKYNFKNFIKI
jgi:hypothetical protein